MFTWNDGFSVGIDEIDNQHKELLNLIAKLFEGSRFKKDLEEIKIYTNNLIEYASCHFDYEVIIMTEYKYLDLVKHKTEHDEIIRRLKEYYNGLSHYDADDYASELMILLKSWFVNHLTYTDKKLYEFLKPLNVDFKSL